MPGKSFTVELNPEVIRWARESSGYSLEEAAARSSTSVDQMSAWESGRRRPNWTALCKLGAVYKRPVASLLLPRAPAEPPPPPDFRMLPNGEGQFSPKTLFAIRTARWLVQKAAELTQELHTDATFAAPRIDLSTDPEEAAGRARQSLGVTIEEQFELSNVWRALKHWRAAVEEQHIFVFQFTMPITDARGFSLMESDQSAIVLNQSDAPSARIFTLFHEYAHLLLSRPGICVPDVGATGTSKRIETFCNRFAAAILVPRTDLEKRLPRAIHDEVIQDLARQYRVSRYVMLGRLHHIDVVSGATYRQTSQRWRRQDATSAQRRRQGGGLTAPARCLLERGRPLISLIVEATKRELITVNEATTYLGTKLKDFRQLAKGA